MITHRRGQASRVEALVLAEIEPSSLAGVVAAMGSRGAAARVQAAEAPGLDAFGRKLAGAVGGYGGYTLAAAVLGPPVVGATVMWPALLGAAALGWGAHLLGIELYDDLLSKPVPTARPSKT